MPRHYRITIEDVLAAHDHALRESGGRPGILNEHGILSAVDRPYSGYFRSIHAKAAALMQALAANHGFVDGNKRTALLAADYFLTQCGYAFVALEGEDLNETFENFMVSIVEDRLTTDAIAQWLKPRIARRPRA